MLEEAGTTEILACVIGLDQSLCKATIAAPTTKAVKV